ncbi:MAG: GNAT family N-acetyltransferase [Rikenellaceae bacterium]
MSKESVKVLYAVPEHTKYAETICELIYESALKRGTGIAKRSPDYIAEKIGSGKAVVALDGDRLVGFSYIETWGHGDFVATSGLIVDPEYRQLGLAEKIKNKTFELARKKFPEAKIFSITTSLPVMKLNSKLGYIPVTFSELTDDEEYWKGCEGCINFDVLQRNQRRMCLCTGMLFDPKRKPKKRSKDDASLEPYMMLLKNKINKIFRLK